MDQVGICSPGEFRGTRLDRRRPLLRAFGILDWWHSPRCTRIAELFQDLLRASCISHSAHLLRVDWRLHPRDSCDRGSPSYAHFGRRYLGSGFHDGGAVVLLAEPSLASLRPDWLGL